MNEISMSSFLPQLQPGSCILPSVFSLVRPHIDFSFHGILSHINTVFVLRSKVYVLFSTRFSALLISTHSPGGENHRNGLKAARSKHGLIVHDRVFSRSGLFIFMSR